MKNKGHGYRIKNIAISYSERVDDECLAVPGVCVLLYYPGPYCHYSCVE